MFISDSSEKKLELYDEDQDDPEAWIPSGGISMSCGNGQYFLCW